MEIKKIDTDKKRFLDLLLLADEQEDMIDRYLERGELYVLDDDEAKAACVVTSEGGACEIKNLAVAPAHQGKGYGRRLIEFVAETYGERCRVLYVGTGEVPRILRFYERCGFVASHRVPAFFTRHYNHPIHEDGVLLADMVYLKRELDGIRRGAGLPPWGL